MINYCEIRDKPFILWADYWKDYANVDAIFFNLSLSQSCNFCCMTILTAVIQEALPGGGVHVARLNFKMSRAGVYKLMLVVYC